MTSTPPPTATAQQAADLRKDLEASGWGVDTVKHALGEVADAALRREIRFPALLAVRAGLAEDRAAGATPSPIAILTALFMLGEPVAAAELDTALRRTRTRDAVAMGLVTAPDDEGMVRALVDLRPHESSDAEGDVRWWVASDLGELLHNVSTWHRRRSLVVLITDTSHPDAATDPAVADWIRRLSAQHELAVVQISDDVPLAPGRGRARDIEMDGEVPAFLREDLDLAARAGAAEQAHRDAVDALLDARHIEHVAIESDEALVDSLASLLARQRLASRRRGRR